MNIVRWDPFRELEDVSTRLGRFFNQPQLRRPVDDDGVFFADWAPAVDVQETDKEYIVKADLPEVRKEDVKVAIEDGVLTLEGERKQEKEEKGKKFHRVERVYGKFVRRLALPMEVDAQKVAAEFKDGVLNVRMPKAENAKPRAIDVKVA
ncbi:MAG TPA: Hsp20/alpha crystallin family protein [Vicinamibacterales bacterium]|nr:Hsp20/alpha crystallin family protein [Vicinamibacterales bacterium]